MKDYLEDTAACGIILGSSLFTVACALLKLYILVLLAIWLTRQVF